MISRSKNLFIVFLYVSLICSAISMIIPLIPNPLAFTCIVFPSFLSAISNVLFRYFYSILLIVLLCLGIHGIKNNKSLYIDIIISTFILDIILTFIFIKYNYVRVFYEISVLFHSAVIISGIIVRRQMSKEVDQDETSRKSLKPIKRTTIVFLVLFAFFNLLSFFKNGLPSMYLNSVCINNMLKELEISFQATYCGYVLITIILFLAAAVSLKKGYNELIVLTFIVCLSDFILCLFRIYLSSIPLLYSTVYVISDIFMMAILLMDLRFSKYENFHS